ncbi:hypothetical protein [Streptomyces formicae]|uniref:Secreted protein n=1 Tax=Streptomyces formicae TaxID=1616117 RepID=A0ABY3WDD4_9ACTN|nr:hypothetical protein [Streptomyces formicae]UNM10573.1 hypothetical protein J4032_02780 [Streptomyces formicae]
MGSLRNPVGPLPSSIYWRRRAVALSLLALLALLVTWTVTSGGGGTRNSGDDGRPGDDRPAPSITPGDDPSGPAISEQPGGRDESSDGGGTGGGDGTGDAGSTDGDADTGKNGDPGAIGAANGGGASAGAQVPAGSPLPNCAPGTLKLTLTSAKVAYAPGEKPRFQLVAKNTSDVTCKADFGPKAAVLTISDNSDDEVWSSADCPSGGGSLLLRVAANSTVSHIVDWDRRQSAPHCATPPAGQVPAGTYLLEARFPGATVAPASFRLEKD